MPQVKISITVTHTIQIDTAAYRHIDPEEKLPSAGALQMWLNNPENADAIEELGELVAYSSEFTVLGVTVVPVPADGVGTP